MPDQVGALAGEPLDLSRPVQVARYNSPAQWIVGIEFEDTLIGPLEASRVLSHGDIWEDKVIVCQEEIM